MDTVSVEQRSSIMAKVRSEGNKSTELALIRAFRERHVVGWRRRYKIIGSPDFCFPKHKVAVFVDGCFWHGCPLHCRLPSTNSSYWTLKIERNMKRDKTVNTLLRKKHWNIVRIWEHELKSGKGLSRKIKRILMLTLDSSS